MVVERPRWEPGSPTGLGGWTKNVCLDERLKRAAPFLDTSLGFLYPTILGFEASG